MLFMYLFSRCFTLMTLPQLCSKRGRQLLLGYALVLTLTGPAHNIILNTRVLSDSLHCGQVSWYTGSSRIPIRKVSKKKRDGFLWWTPADGRIGNHNTCMYGMLPMAISAGAHRRVAELTISPLLLELTAFPFFIDYCQSFPFRPGNSRLSCNVMRFPIFIYIYIFDHVTDIWYTDFSSINELRLGITCSCSLLKNWK